MLMDSVECVPRYQLWNVLIVCRTKLQNQESLMEQIERERTENSELKIKVHRVETEYNSYISSERVSAEINRCNHQ